MNLLNYIEQHANNQLIKYYCSKEMFCKYSGKVLDYKKATLFEATKDGKDVGSQIIDNSLLHKLDEVIDKANKDGVKITMMQFNKTKKLN